ncbi:MAG: family 16 glycosylhydrolase [Bacteroidota bacterium]|jgi:hypothetical protein
MKKITATILFLLFFGGVKKSISQSSCVKTSYNKVFNPYDCSNVNQNIIANPGFDVTSSTDWTAIPSASRAVLTSGGYASTAKCMKLISLNTSDGDAMISQTIPNLTPATTYKITAYFKSNLAVNVSTLSATLQVRLNYVGGASNTYSSTFYPNSTWTKYSCTFTVPGTAGLLTSMVQVMVYRGQNNSIFVDKIELPDSSRLYSFVNERKPTAPTGIFQDSFKGTGGNLLPCNKWLVVKKAWGNNGDTPSNNGVVPENVKLVYGGGIRFIGHGDNYTGSVRGSDSIMGNGKIRVGACIATKDYYASGKYEVVAKVTPGMINAFWTFHYIEDPDYQSGGIKNTEIDFEFPGSPGGGTYTGSGVVTSTGHKTVIDDMNLNTWGGLCNGEGFHSSQRYRTPGGRDLSQAFHKYTIVWRTGGGGVTPSIKWYVDDTLVKQETNAQHIGFRAARFWIGVWYGKNEWVNGYNSAVMAYSEKYMEVKSVKITPYYDANDVYENETVPAVGYVTNQYAGYPRYPTSSMGKYDESINDAEKENIELSDLNDIKTKVEIFSNMSDGSIKLKLISNSSNDKFSKINIHNLNGQLIETINIENQSQEVEFNFGNSFKNGIYIIEGITTGGTPFNKKFTILN